MMRKQGAAPAPTEGPARGGGCFKPSPEIQIRGLQLPTPAQVEALLDLPVTLIDKELDLGL